LSDMIARKHQTVFHSARVVMGLCLGQWAAPRAFRPVGFSVSTTSLSGWQGF
jgi:hypothetical protein